MILLNELIIAGILTPTGKIKKHSQEYINQNEQIQKKLSEFNWCTTLTEIVYCIRNNILQAPLCKTCNTPLKFQQCGKYFQYCSTTCASSSPIIKDKKKLTCLAKYGVENNFKAKEIKDKIKQHMQQTYGVDFISQATTIKDKKKNNIQQIHGVDSIFQSEYFKEKSRQTVFSKHNVYTTNHIHISPTSLEKLNNIEWLINEQHNNSRTVTDIANELGVQDTTILLRFKQHNIDVKIHNGSQAQREILSFITDTGKTAYSTRSIIPPQEIDIYIPSINMGIEYNGLYYHSELTGRNKHYHINKTLRCNEQGVHLIHIWENEWLYKKPLIESRILSYLKLNNTIGARKCNIVELDQLTANTFLNDNHIQGGVISSYRIGLEYQGELVAVMTFGNSRYDKQYKYELLRYASKQGINVAGGASKLFKFFITNKKTNSISSYSDIRWNTGNMYATLGFTKIHNTPPNYWYFKQNTNIIVSRIQFQKHKLQNKLTIFDPKLTEWENMQLNGYNRIWDCGSIKWGYK